MSRKRITRYRKKIEGKVDPIKLYPVGEAIELSKQCARDTFPESLDASFVLGIDTRKADQMIRGSVVLPHGIGKTVQVVVFCQNPHQMDAAKEAGADQVGFEDLIDAVQKGFLDFDVAIASPDVMSAVSKIGPILGPRGLMPNPKDGTVTADVGLAVKNAKAGQVSYRPNSAGIVNASFGKLSFDTNLLFENLQAFMKALVRAKPPGAKGVYIKRLSISSTMGPGVGVDMNTLGVN